MSSPFLTGWTSEQTGNIVDALSYYKLAQEQGDECAIFHLNCMEKYGQGVPIIVNHKLDWRKLQLKDETFELLYQLYSDDTSEHIFNRGVLYELQKDISKAKACFESIDYPAAWTKLASILNKEGRHSESLQFYERASKAGYHFAQYRLGIWYLYNNQKEHGIYWLEHAIAQNYYRAYTVLGLFYCKHTEYQKAHPLFISAAELGCKKALHMLGHLHRKGHGVQIDYVKAFEYNLKASNAGCKASYAMIGFNYYYGHGVEQNYEEAFNWFQKADQTGYIYHGLGELYLEGHGVTQDYNKSMEYYLKRANKDDNYGLYGVGYLYFEGFGVTQNMSLALSYFERASKQNHNMSMIKVKYINTLPKKINNIVNKYGNHPIDFVEFKQELLRINIKNCYDPLVIQWIFEAVKHYGYHHCDIINMLHDN